MTIVSTNSLTLADWFVTTRTKELSSIDLHTGAFERSIETNVGFLALAVGADGVVAVACCSSREDETCGGGRGRGGESEGRREAWFDGSGLLT